MIDGPIAPLGSHYVVTLTATDCNTGEVLARTQAEATNNERVLAELGTIASAMRTQLGESLPSIARFDVPIEQATTPSLTALKAYTLGLEERRRGRELESLAFFNQAIEIDRDFAPAHTTLSTVYGGIGEWRPQRTIRAAGQQRHAIASVSANACSSPTSTTTASPATRIEPPRRWRRGRRLTRATSCRPTPWR